MSFHKTVSQPENMLTLTQPRRLGRVCVCVCVNERNTEVEGGMRVLFVMPNYIFEKM